MQYRLTEMRGEEQKYAPQWIVIPTDVGLVLMLLGSIWLSIGWVMRGVRGRAAPAAGR